MKPECTNLNTIHSQNNREAKITGTDKCSGGRRSLMTRGHIRRLVQTLWDVTMRTNHSLGPSGLDSDFVWLLGKPYKLPQDRARFLVDFQSRIWCTYRTGFEPVGTNNQKTDTGWGCMLRCGQMVLAQALIMRMLGRDWRFDPKKTEEQECDEQYYEIVRWFLDHPEEPYSIHRIANEGISLDKGVGQWFGPATIAQVIKRLSSSPTRLTSEHCVTTHIAMDGVVYVDQLNECIPKFKEQIRLERMKEMKENRQDHIRRSSGRKHSAPVGTEDDGPNDLLLLVPLRLGLTSIHPKYMPQLKEILTLPYTLGIVGGKPNAAYYFIGWHGDSFLYLDPHTTQPVVDPGVDGYFPTTSYHSSGVSSIAMEYVDPSLALAFFLPSQAAIDEFCTMFSQPSPGVTPLFTVVQKMPEFFKVEVPTLSRDSCMSMTSPSEEFEEDYEFV